MKLGQEIVSCTYDSAITQTLVNSNQETTGYLAVAIANPGTNLNTPVPHVILADNTDDGGSPKQYTANPRVYGALATINTGTQRCGVITKGIVPFNKGAISATTDIGFGILAASTDGTVNVTTAGLGRGQVVARGGNRLFVDLDTDVNAVA